MNSNIFYAMLAMDSYNRGYEPSINNNDNKRIGNVIVEIDSDVLGKEIAQSDHFYAVAYNYNGKKIISYRGTDDVGDRLTGWPGGGGVPESPQSKLAFAFYNAVAGDVDPRTANITLVGHSLGGGLAGFVGGVYHQKSFIFDNMAFEDAADTAYWFADSVYKNVPILKPNHQRDTDAEQSGQRMLEAIYHNMSPWKNDLGGLTAMAVEGEFLGNNRGLQDTPVRTITLSDEVDIDLFDRHSMATLVILLFGEENGLRQDSQPAEQYVVPFLYDNELAIQTGASAFDGISKEKGEYADIMRTAIAYSAIDEGTRIFGDTGIKALFSDAGDLGKALKIGGEESPLVPHVEDISKLLVMFSGEMAVHKVEESEHPHTVEGALHLDERYIGVDLSKETWEVGGNEDKTNRYKTVDEWLTQISEEGEQDVRAAMVKAWGSKQSKKIETAIFSPHDDTEMTLPESPHGRKTLYYGNDGTDKITGSSHNDLIYTGDGRDTVYWSKGADVVNGGADIDVFDCSTATQGVFINPSDISAFVAQNIETYKGSDHDDVVNGAVGRFNEVFYDGDGADYIWGDGGKDRFIADQDGTTTRSFAHEQNDDEYAPWQDTFTGGNGADTFVFDGHTGKDIIADISSTDTVIVNGVDLSDMHFVSKIEPTESYPWVQYNTDIENNAIMRVFPNENAAVFSTLDGDIIIGFSNPSEGFLAQLDIDTWDSIL